MLVYERIMEKAKVLEVGCASGYFGKKLIEKKCRVWGVEKDCKEAKKASSKFEEVFILDLDDITNQIPGYIRKNSFDYILFMDILEHLKDPASVLSFFSTYLKNTGKIIISVPNIAFISIRLALLRGKFSYTDQGIMDNTHLRFFTKDTLFALIKKSELIIEDLEISSGFSQISVIGKYLDKIPKYWQYIISKKFPSLLGYQFIAICRKK